MANNWTSAERKLFDYFLNALGDTENRQAFAPIDAAVRENEYLPGLRDSRYAYMWTCWFEGGGETADRGPTDTLCYVRGAAYFRGFFTSRDTAREYAVAVSKLLPIHNTTAPSAATVLLWRHLFISADPSIRLGVARRVVNQSGKAGEVLGWVLEIQMDGGIQAT